MYLLLSRADSSRHVMPNTSSSDFRLSAVTVAIVCFFISIFTIRTNVCRPYGKLYRCFITTTTQFFQLRCPYMQQLLLNFSLKRWQGSKQLLHRNTIHLPRKSEVDVGGQKLRHGWQNTQAEVKNASKPAVAIQRQ